MPEIAEVARIVHFLRLHIIGKRIVSASAIDDSNVFGKVGTSGEEVQSSLNGKTVVSAASQGKYFWITFDKPPHLVMHFGMSGWMHIKGEKTAYTNYYKKLKKGELEAWPPKFWKFHFTTSGTPSVAVAFTDPRRFGRVRLVDCPGDAIRTFTPLSSGGPDPVIDVEVFTEEYLRDKMRTRRVPIKALLLDQSMISGIGNWVADETLFQAKLHPEQYCDEFDDAAVKVLYDSIRYVCGTAVEKLADSDQFPEDWLFKHRWGKGSLGKGTPARLPNGEKLDFITVGGRTSCYAPGIQKKKTARTKREAAETGEDGKGAKKSRKASSKYFDDDAAVPATKKKKSVAASKKALKEEEEEEEVVKTEVAESVKPELGRRRSARLRR